MRKETRVILRKVAAMAYMEESQLVRMAGTVAQFLGRPELHGELASPAAMRDIRSSLLKYLEQLADGDYVNVARVQRALGPDGAGLLDERIVSSDLPAMVIAAMALHLRGAHRDQIRRCSDGCGKVIVTVRKPKRAGIGSYCSAYCGNRAVETRKKTSSIEKQGTELSLLSQ